MEQDRDDPAADMEMEMTTNEAAAYLSSPVGSTLSAKLVRGLRYLDRGPVVEKRSSRLVYRKSALDAFLTEYGTNPNMWTQGSWREVAVQLRRTGDPGFNDLIETLERRDPPDEWDLDQAEK